MTTAENLNRIIQAKADIKTAIENKGITVGDITIDGYANKIAAIEGGGVSDTTLEKNAIVLDITKNGTYYTQYVDVPEPVYTGDDGFKGYATMNATGSTGSLNTNYIGDEYTVVELWFRHFGNNSEDNSIVQRFYYGGSYRLMVNGENGIFEIGKSKYEFTLPTGEFLHIKFSNNGLWLNDELVLDNLPLYTEYQNNKWEIGGAGNCGIGDYGMIKIDDNVYIPTENGFINQSTGEVLPYATGTPFVFTYNQIIPPFISNNLIKQVNVNAKINVHESQIKLAYSSNTTIPEWLDYSNISKEDLKDFFYNSSITSLNGLENIDTSKLTSLNSTFYYCGKLLDISPISNWDTNNVTDMSYMFYYCTNLTSIDLSNWDTSKVTNMNQMFRNCSNLTSLDLSNWDTSKVTNMADTFGACSNLATLSSIRADSLSIPSYSSPFGSSNNTTLVDFGGFINLKNSWNGSYCLDKVTALSHQSLVNILNGLYDFTGNGETPTSSQGKIKFGSTHLANLSDEEKAIATNKGWVLL